MDAINQTMLGHTRFEVKNRTIDIIAGIICFGYRQCKRMGLVKSLWSLVGWQVVYLSACSLETNKIADFHTIGIFVFRYFNLL